VVTSLITLLTGEHAEHDDDDEVEPGRHAGNSGDPGSASRSPQDEVRVRRLTACGSHRNEGAEMLTVTQLANRSGTSPNVVRYYTRMGLLRPERNPDRGIPLLDESRHEPPHNGSTPGISHECPQPPVMPRFPANTPTPIRTMAIRKPKNPIMISTMADQPLNRCPPQRRRAGDPNTDNRTRDECVGRHHEQAFRQRHSISAKFDLIEQQKFSLFTKDIGSGLH
jgi:hypothetical protein